MVNTIKFSEFKVVDPTNEELLTVGLSEGENAISETDMKNAAFKSVTDANEDFVASTQGSFTTGHVLIAADDKGTVKDGGNPVGTGTVTQVSSGTGLTGGPINSSGTLSFASITAQSLWANNTGGTAVPTVIPLSTFLLAANNLSELTDPDTAFSNIGLGAGTTIDIDDSDFIANIYSLPVPCPNVINATITTPNMEIRLPIADAFNSPALSTGPIIQMVSSTEDLDVNDYSGNNVTTITNDSRNLFALDSKSTSDGTWLIHPITSTVNGFSGTVVLAGDDIDAAISPVNYTPTSSDISGNFAGIDNTLATLSTLNNNLIYAGNFSTNPWQRGTSGFTANGSVTADRFLIGLTGAGTVEVSKVADAPLIADTGVFTQDCLAWEVTGADASIAATDIYRIFYKMRGFDFTSIAQRSFTLSFRVKSSVEGIYCVSFVNSGSDRSYIAEYEVSVADTWEYKTLTVSASPTGGTWNYTTGTGLTIGFTIAAGSNFQTTANAWQTGNFASTVNQVNGMDTMGNLFKIDLLKLEIGENATPYVNYAPLEVLQNCQAEYEKSYNFGVDPATATTDGILSIDTGTATTADIFLPVTFSVSKNSTPTIVLYDAAGNSGKVTKGGDNKTGVSSYTGAHGFSMGCSDLTLSSSLSGHFTAATGY